MNARQTARLAKQLIFMFGTAADHVDDGGSAMREHANEWCENNGLPRLTDETAEAVSARVLVEYERFARLYHRPDAEGPS